MKRAAWAVVRWFAIAFALACFVLMAIGNLLFSSPNPSNRRDDK